jgi:hypothetical protein
MNFMPVGNSTALLRPNCARRVDMARLTKGRQVKDSQVRTHASDSPYCN